MAGSLGARYLISVIVTQMGGQMYMQATCMDTKTAKSVERADKQTNSQGAADSAESLARKFVQQLGPLFAVKPESGKTYPVGTAFPAIHQRSFRGNAHFKSTWTEALAWVQSSGKFEDPRAGEGDSHLHCGPQDFGSCGGCKDCSCAGNCYIKLNSPGRYRLVNVTESIDSPDLQVQSICEVTIEGSCKK
jgi:hypothetical protein